MISIRAQHAVTRSRREVELAPAASVFTNEAREIPGPFERATAAAQRAGRGEIGEPSVGFVTIDDHNVLPSVLIEFRSHHPEIHPDLREVPTDARSRNLAG